MRLSVVVMAHESRLVAAESLAEQLHAEISLHVGRTSLHGERENGDRAWRMIDRPADWGIVIQDDAIPMLGFLEHAEAALAHAEAPCVSFYTGTGQPLPGWTARTVERADELGAAWLWSRTLLWGVAVAIRTEHIRPMLDHVGGRRAPYDERIGSYFAKHRMPVWYTHPSLVDHRDDGTLLPGKKLLDSDRGRRAHRVGVPSTWATSAVHISHRP